MSILRKSFQIDFTQVPNFIINDKNVSLKAKGLYLYMVSKPDMWQFSLNGMVSQLKESKTTILLIIDELIKVGYMDKIKTRLNGKQGLNEYILHLEPQLRSESSLQSQKNRVRKAESVICTTSNTNISNTKESNTLSSNINRVSGINFDNYRKDFIGNNIFIDGFFIVGYDNYDSDIIFIVNTIGMLMTASNLMLLSRDKAYDLWSYMFMNQDSVIPYSIDSVSVNNIVCDSLECLK